MASIPQANLALEGGDPRKSLQTENITADGVGRIEHFNDRVVSFEEYMYYAAITRAEEEEANARFIAARGPRTIKNIIKGRFVKGPIEQAASTPQIADSLSTKGTEEKGHHDSALQTTERTSNGNYGVTEAQRQTADRALRTASWGTIFYLITTDILGPTGAPWAFAQLGYGPGVALYTVFGAMSYYSGWILWKVFCGLDSNKFPIRGYGDFFFRIFGAGARHFVNVAQALQLLLTVSVLILSNGQSISQISRGSSGDSMGICFVACMLIFMAAGFILGQIRTLQRLGWLANVSVWLTVTLVLMCMASVGYGPNYAAIETSFGLPPGMPIQTFAGTPPPGLATGGEGFIGSLNGLNVAVYAYGGALLFAALLAEMRHPMDFWKSLLVAEVFIYSMYIFFGIFIYSYQGQYTYNPVVQGIAVYGIQTAGNILSLVSNLIAAVLYSNIGLKVVYVEVFHELLKFPDLTTRPGKIWWAALIPVYWAIAFIIAATVPQFSYIVGLVGALFILSFTYTFPAWLAVGYWIKKDAIIEAEERFDPTTNTYNYVDHGWKRWRRGFMKKPFFNSFNIFYFLGALVTCGLGCYSSIESLRQAFDSNIATSLSCTPPL
ncbi:transmembrane amino acid transporter protein-domain-containing protein [Annulohypoxylon maeteangense]|uniref:transmembrane amino acid transporter protein-domain-containing protein n=1 Tax=Annulohypoxylon maeteangense TaxID=1927788 RepID=UPI002008B4DC|nr:transmembrane amino acid transporter protein-domain-containing protein [Annulohypoxylon maeteangense]KAI0887069.1 transmembrane amino acid transporter protein-domain-containing protein [Annulohypoxylon maeteangense]